MFNVLLKIIIDRINSWSLLNIQCAAGNLQTSKWSLFFRTRAHIYLRIIRYDSKTKKKMIENRKEVVFQHISHINRSFETINSIFYSHNLSLLTFFAGVHCTIIKDIMNRIDLFMHTQNELRFSCARKKKCSYFRFFLFFFCVSIFIVPKIADILSRTELFMCDFSFIWFPFVIHNSYELQWIIRSCDAFKCDLRTMGGKFHLTVPIW